jgi:4-hydroxy-L-threonine phosphate dehydrogenase PdxA
MVVAMYHDQDIFRSNCYFYDGVNITAGLPFIRTLPITAPRLI